MACPSGLGDCSCNDVNPGLRVIELRTAFGGCFHAYVNGPGGPPRDPKRRFRHLTIEIDVAGSSAVSFRFQGEMRKYNSIPIWPSTSAIVGQTRSPIGTSSTVYSPTKATFESVYGNSPSPTVRNYTDTSKEYLTYDGLGNLIAREFWQVSEEYPHSGNPAAIFHESHEFLRNYPIETVPITPATFGRNGGLRRIGATGDIDDIGAAVAVDHPMINVSASGSVRSITVSVGMPPQSQNLGAYGSFLERVAFYPADGEHQNFCITKASFRPISQTDGEDFVRYFCDPVALIDRYDIMADPIYSETLTHLTTANVRSAGVLTCNCP